MLVHKKCLVSEETLERNGIIFVRVLDLVIGLHNSNVPGLFMTDFFKIKTNMCRFLSYTIKSEVKKIAPGPNSKNLHAPTRHC